MVGEPLPNGHGFEVGVIIWTLLLLVDQGAEVHKVFQFIEVVDRHSIEKAVYDPHHGYVTVRGDLDLPILLFLVDGECHNSLERVRK